MLDVLWTHSTTAPEAAARRAPEGTNLIVARSSEEAEEHADRVSVLVDPHPSERLLAGKSLSHLVVPYAGVGAALRRDLAGRDVTVHNSHFNDEMVAQHMVALTLAVANRVVVDDRALRRGDWGPPEFRVDGRGTFLKGKSGLLLGNGAIAKAATPALEALGLSLTAFRRRPRPGQRVPEVGREGLHEALAEADVVLCSLPLTDETRGLIGRAELAQLKKTALVVNVGRGPVIDEGALFDALRSGRIKGAAIDVWWVYPEDDAARGATHPSSHPYRELDNVVMTPHSANDVAGWKDVAVDDVFATIEAIRDGVPRNVVDLSAGY